MDVEPEPTTPASSPETPAPEIPMDSPDDDGNGADVPIAVRGAGMEFSHGFLAKLASNARRTW